MIGLDVGNWVLRVRMFGILGSWNIEGLGCFVIGVLIMF